MGGGGGVPKTDRSVTAIAGQNPTAIRWAERKTHAKGQHRIPDYIQTPDRGRSLHDGVGSPFVLCIQNKHVVVIHSLARYGS